MSYDNYKDAVERIRRQVQTAPKEWLEGQLEGQLDLMKQIGQANHVDELEISRDVIDLRNIELEKRIKKEGWKDPNGL